MKIAYFIFCFSVLFASGKNDVDVELLIKGSMPIKNSEKEFSVDFLLSKTQKSIIEIEELKGFVERSMIEDHLTRGSLCNKEGMTYVWVLSSYNAQFSTLLAVRGDKVYSDIMSLIASEDEVIQPLRIRAKAIVAEVDRRLAECEKSANNQHGDFLDMALEAMDEGVDRPTESVAFSYEIHAMPLSSLMDERLKIVQRYGEALIEKLLV